MSKIDTLPKPKDPENYEQEGLESLGQENLTHFRHVFAKDNIDKIFRKPNDGITSPMLREHYVSSIIDLTSHTIRTSLGNPGPDQTLEMFKNGGFVNGEFIATEPVAVTCSRLTADVLRDEAEERLGLYDNYMYQITEDKQWRKVENEQDNFLESSPAHQQDKLTEDMIGELAANEMHTCTMGELEEFISYFINNKLTKQDYSEVSQLGKIKKALKLGKAVDIVKKMGLPQNNQGRVKRAPFSRMAMGILGIR